MTLELYIEGQRVDLYKDESISITDSIQNIREIDKVFTAYSQPFSVPASSTNNKVFKHYYNADIVNGFDARIRVNAEIRLNGILYKSGKIRLDSVSLKNNKAMSYRLIFFGSTVELTDLLGDDELKDLPYLNNYNHEYSNSNVYAGLSGLDFGAETNVIVYPLIVYTEQFVVNGTFQRLSDGSKLDYTDLKPAIKVLNIIDAIEDKYGLTFTEDFFFNTNTNLSSLYMALNRDKGLITGADGSVLILNVDDFDLSSGTNILASPLTATINGAVGTAYNLNFDITVTGSGEITARVIDLVTGDVLRSVTTDTGTANFTANLDPPATNGERTYVPQLIVESESGVTALTITLDVEEIDLPSGSVSVDGAYETTPNSLSPVSELIITDQMPKMKVIDFLKSLFKMFNLTAFVNADGEIEVRTLASFYGSGADIDITRWVDVSESEVKRAIQYKTFDFKFEEGETQHIEFRSNIIGDRYGDLEYQLDSQIDGEAYEINVGFEKIVGEKLTDQASGSISPFVVMHALDKDYQPIETKPVLFYWVPQLGALPFEGQANTVSYPRASNSRYNIIDGALSTINFGAEIDEFTLETNENSLFQNFYQTEITDTLNPRSRLYTFTAYPPTNFLLTYKLNDKIIIAGRRYRINSISTDLLTRKTDLELINEL